jgi:hypothetical protein
MRDEKAVKRPRSVSRAGKRAFGVRDLLCWCHEHLGRDAYFPALRGKGASQALDVILSEPPFGAAGSVPEVRRKRGADDGVQNQSFA